jgi:hypothetical protein
MPRIHLYIHRTWDAYNPNESRDPDGKWSEGGNTKPPTKKSPVIHLGTTDEELNNYYPRAGNRVDGRTVLDGVPNESSIDATLTNPEILPGIREVSMSYFPNVKTVRDWFTSKDDLDRVDDLANRIKASGEISPLIVIHDNEGAYILEGAHRGAALTKLGAKSFPALVVLDLDSLPDK